MGKPISECTRFRDAAKLAILMLTGVTSDPLPKFDINQDQALHSKAKPSSSVPAGLFPRTLIPSRHCHFKLH